VDRDLSSHDIWADSLARSRDRRARAAASSKSSFDLPTRGLSVAALVAVTGGTVATVGVAAVGGDDAPETGAGGAGTQKAAVAAEAPKRVANAVAAPEAGAPAPTSRAAADQVSSTADVQPTGLRARIAESLREGQEGEGALEPDGAKASVASAATVEDAPQTVEDAPQTEEVATEEGAEQPEPPAEAQAPADAEDAPDTEQEDAPQAKQDEDQGLAAPGGGVGELQQALGVPVDGDFGPQTKRALKRWQGNHGLTADGIAGPQTREALGIGEGKVLKPERPKRADSGSRHTSTAGGQRSGGGVKALQQALGVGADGVFGSGTEQALKQWQRSHGLTADGVAGPQTREALGLGSGKVLKRRGAGGGGGSRAGGDSSIVARVIAAGNRIATTPYVYGGGHGSFEASGYDCSGSVSYALHGGDLLSSPLDSTGLMSYGEPGPGKRITIYANSGHAYMVIDGRRYDTSARSETGSRWSSTQRSSSGYVVRHPRGF
jgi:peptidoglycan hydrolase-like protein with peptidoglycan-binding domain